MVKRDRDKLIFDNEDHKRMGYKPPGHWGLPLQASFGEPPHRPPFGGPPPFVPLPPFPGLHPKAPFPMGREAFQEIRDYMLLIIISEYPDGITGYQLQETYKFPRGTLIRTLQDLEEKGYLEARDEIIEGRANKFYSITEVGKRFLEELKLKWANIFGMMADINPPEGFKKVIFQRIEEFESLDDAIDFFRGIRSWMKGMLNNIEEKIENFRKSNKGIDELIEDIENMDTLNKEKIKHAINEMIKKMEAI